MSDGVVIALVLFAALEITFVYLLIGVVYTIYIMLHFVMSHEHEEITTWRIIKMILFWLPKFTIIKLRRQKHE